MPYVPYLRSYANISRNKLPRVILRTEEFSSSATETFSSVAAGVGAVSIVPATDPPVGECAALDDSVAPRRLLLVDVWVAVSDAAERQR